MSYPTVIRANVDGLDSVAIGHGTYYHDDVNGGWFRYSTYRDGYVEVDVDLWETLYEELDRKLVANGTCRGCREAAALPGFDLCGECASEARADEAFHMDR